MTTTAAPKRTYKSFEYRTSTRWVSDKKGAIASNGKPEVGVASPPEFKGVPGVWTPEDLFVAAIDVCQMTTFLSFAARTDLQLRSYESAAHGLLEFADGGYRFTRVTLKPRITVGPDTDQRDVERLVHDAHTHCLIVRSVNSVVDVEPEIILQCHGEIDPIPVPSPL